MAQAQRDAGPFASGKAPFLELPTAIKLGKSTRCGVYTEPGLEMVMSKLRSDRRPTLLLMLGLSLAVVPGLSAQEEAAQSMTWSNSVTNTADTRRMIGFWADRLVKFLQSHYK